MKKENTLFKAICSLLMLFGVLACSGNDKQTVIINVSLEEEILTMLEGDQHNLVAKTDSSEEVALVWESSDETVAIVDDSGVVTALKDGLTVITAKYAEDSNSYAICTVNVNAKLIDVEDKDITFNSKTMPAYLFSQTEKIDVEVHFREDRLKKIPYISLKEFYKDFIGIDLIIEELEDSVYQITSGIGGVAVFDTENETIESDDFQKFICTTQIRQEGAENVYYNSSPFLRINRTEYENPAEKTCLSLKKYNINMVGKDNDIYLPLVTASNIFSGPSMATVLYNKNNIYFVDGYDPKYTSTDVISNFSYQSGVLEMFENERRTYDEVQFSYGQLCFLIDTYYGLPGRELLHEKLNETRDLDKALDEYNDLSKTAKTLLKSKDMVEYFAGIVILNDLLYDAGHSYAAYGLNAMFTSSPTLQKRVNACLNKIPYRSGETKAKDTCDTSYQTSMARKRFETGVRALSSIKKGDTVMFTFDSFVFNKYSWEEYYKDPKLENLPRDVVGNFKRVLEQYKNDSSVKNIVIDISNNGGGMADVVMALMGLMTGKTYQYAYDSINKNYLTTYYDFDANFDGKFNEEDAEVKYDYNFAILCSNYSFSCGNMLPMQAKENGIMIVGDKSGGGSCAVIICCTAEGMFMRISCPYHMSPLDKSDVEFGIQADAKLVTDTGPNSKDFKNFYNLERISEEMANFYKN